MDAKRVKEITKTIIKAEHDIQPPTQRDAIKKLEAAVLQAWEAEEYAETFEPFTIQPVDEPKSKPRLGELRFKIHELLRKNHFTFEQADAHLSILDYLEEKEQADA